MMMMAAFDVYLNWVADVESRKTWTPFSKDIEKMTIAFAEYQMVLEKLVIVV